MKKCKADLFIPFDKVHHLDREVICPFLKDTVSRFIRVNDARIIGPIFFGIKGQLKEKR